MSTTEELTSEIISHAWIETHSRKRFHYLKPELDQIEIEDIAHALSMQCRFAGHINRFYSVAEHSILVAKIVRETLNGSRLAVRCALMHDATEAYLTDIPHPLKRLLPDYQRYEEIAWRAIATKFNLPSEIPEIVKRADRLALVTEAYQLYNGELAEWMQQCDPIPVGPMGLRPLEAKRDFLETFRRYFENHS